MSKSKSNKRRNFRTNFEMGRVIDFKLEGEAEKLNNALLLEESYGGVSCVTVGKTKIKKGDVLEIIESDSWLTLCEVIRAEEIKPNLFLLALKFKDDSN